jgi:hypothetical protein
VIVTTNREAVPLPTTPEGHMIKARATQTLPSVILPIAGRVTMNARWFGLRGVQSAPWVLPVRIRQQQTLGRGRRSMRLIYVF